MKKYRYLLVLCILFIIFIIYTAYGRNNNVIGYREFDISQELGKTVELRYFTNVETAKEQYAKANINDYKLFRSSNGASQTFDMFPGIDLGGNGGKQIEVSFISGIAGSISQEGLTQFFKTYNLEPISK